MNERATLTSGPFGMNGCRLQLPGRPGKERGTFAHAPAGRVETSQCVEALVRHTARSTKLAPELLRLRRHEREEEHALPREIARQRGEHVVEIGVLRAVLRQRPRLGRLYVLVSPRDTRQCALDALLEQKASAAVHGGMILGEIRDVRLIERGALAGRNDTAPVFLDHRDDAASEIAPRVRELRCVALIEALPREVAVAVEGDLSEQKETQRVRTMAVDRLL